MSDSASLGESVTAETGPPLWPGLAWVAAQWLATFVPSLVVPATPVQFFGLVGGPALGLLGLLMWWGRRGNVPRRERIFTLLLPFLAFLPAFLLVHPSARMAIYLYGIPLYCALFLAWIAWRRGLDIDADGGRSRLALQILAATALFSAGLWVFVRSEGVDGDMSPDFAWRWAQSAEDRLLSTEIGSDLEAPRLALESSAWPGFRGADRRGVVLGSRLESDWQSSPPEILWRRAIGPGWSSFAVAGDVLFTQEQRGEEEIVAAYRASTGEPLWLHSDPVRFWEPLAGAGPRATPTFDRGRLYAFGATGLLNALDARDGSRLWQRDTAADTGAETPEWGFASSPLSVDGQVIVHTGAPEQKGLAAYDAETGKPLWTAAAPGLSYSSVHLAEVAGQRQLLLPTGDGIAAYSLRGETLWSHEWPVPGGARVVQPVVVHGAGADGVLVGTGFGMGVRRLDVSKGFDVEARWTSKRLKPYYNDFVAHEGFVYGFDGRILACLDLETGELQWKGGRYGNGQMVLLADQDLLLVLTDRGEVALVETTPEGFSEIARTKAIEGKTWNHPVLVESTLYVRNAEQMAALRLPVLDGEGAG